MLGNRRNLAGDLRLSITPAGDGEHVGFVQAADRSERAGRVAVQRGIPHHGLALVARVHQHPAVCVRQRHEAHHAAARLRVLGRQTRELAAARLGKRGLERPIRFRDGDGARPDSEVASQIERIVHRVVGGVRARHEHAVHAIRAQRVRTHHGDQTRVHAARQPDDDVGESSVVHEAFERVHAETIPFAILHDSLFLHHHLADPPMSARSAKVPEIAPFRQLRRAKRKSL